jgi:hypothetical protein
MRRRASQTKSNLRAGPLPEKTLPRTDASIPEKTPDFPDEQMTPEFLRSCIDSYLRRLQGRERAIAWDFMCLRVLEQMPHATMWSSADGAVEYLKGVDLKRLKLAKSFKRSRRKMEP